MTPPRLGSWGVRRTFMFVVSAFCCWVVAYVLINRIDTRPADTAVMFALLGLLGIVGSYVFGAVWQDIKFKQADTYASYGPYQAPPTFDDRPR